MSKHWEKEDRHCWQKSEVMQNFEKTLLENYSKLVLAQQKINLPQVKELKTDLEGANVAAKDLSKTLTGAADDGEVNDAEDCSMCGTVNDVHDQSCEYSEDAEYTDNEVKQAKDSVLSELRKMASDAIEVRDMKLAYQIERTIQEMLESEDDQ